MDEFEKTIATEAGHVRYQEKVSIPSLMRGLLLGSPVLLATSLGTFGAYSGGFHWAVGVAAGLGMGAVAGLANLALMGQRVVVSDHAIDIYVGIRKRTFALSDVVQVERATYRLRDFPLGRDGVKHSLTGDMAFTQTLSSTGISLTLRNGKKVFISSSDPDAFTRAIQTQTPMQVRVAAPDEAQDAALEAEAEEANPKASRRA
jgi:uncharacterized membrane protein (UPF0136 family)